MIDKLLNKISVKDDIELNIKYLDNKYNVSIYRENKNYYRCHPDFGLSVNLTNSNNYFKLSDFYKSNNLKSTCSHYLIIDNKLININIESLSYKYYNFNHKDLAKLLYITINLDKTDVSIFKWKNYDLIEELIINDMFDWNDQFSSIIINKGCPLFIIEPNGNTKILGIYFTKILLKSDEPLLWFIPSTTIINYFKNNFKVVLDHNIIRDKKKITKDIILYDDQRRVIKIPKNSKLSTYNDILLDTLDKSINFLTYQKYNPLTRLSYTYKNKLYIINNIDTSYRPYKIYIPIFLSDHKTFIKLSDNILLGRLSLYLINKIISSNLLINSKLINDYLNNIYNYEHYNIYNDHNSVLVLLYYKGSTDKYNFLNNLYGNYINIIEYVENRPQIINMPIIKKINYTNIDIIENDIIYSINYDH